MFVFGLHSTSDDQPSDLSDESCPNWDEIQFTPHPLR